MIDITFMRGDYEPYELAYYRESDRADRAERKVIHLEEEVQIVEEQLGNWQKFYKHIKPQGDKNQIGWCDLCVNLKKKNSEICYACEMGSNFEYDETNFGELKDE